MSNSIYWLLCFKSIQALYLWSFCCQQIIFHLKKLCIAPGATVIGTIASPEKSTPFGANYHSKVTKLTYIYTVHKFAVGNGFAHSVLVKFSQKRASLKTVSLSKGCRSLRRSPKIHHKRYRYHHSIKYRNRLGHDNRSKQFWTFLQRQKETVFFKKRCNIINLGYTLGKLHAEFVIKQSVYIFTLWNM